MKTSSPTEVYLIVERVLVTIGFFAMFVALAITGHFNGSIAAAMTTGLGAVIVVWFGGATTSAKKDELQTIVHEVLSNVPTLVQNLPIPTAVKTEVNAAAAAVDAATAVQQNSGAGTGGKA